MNAHTIDRPGRVIPVLLRTATAVALVAAAIGTVTTGRWSTAAGGIAVAVVVAAPLLRVALLGLRWLRVGDRRYALAALALLAVTGGGAALAML